jgi:hypothetical protein
MDTYPIENFRHIGSGVEEEKNRMLDKVLGKDRLGSVIRYPCYGDYR